MGKGQNFEREICKRLSLWFSDGERDDLFWRTAGSGARATVRAQKGKRTQNQAGDVAGTVQETIDWLGDGVIELKTGYKRFMVNDWFTKSSVFRRWVNRLDEQTDDWMLIHRNRETIVIVTEIFLVQRCVMGEMEHEDWQNLLVDMADIHIMPFDIFLKYFKPGK